MGKIGKVFFFFFDFGIRQSAGNIVKQSINKWRAVVVVVVVMKGAEMQQGKLVYFVKENEVSYHKYKH